MSIKKFFSFSRCPKSIFKGFTHFQTKIRNDWATFNPLKQASLQNISLLIKNDWVYLILVAGVVFHFIIKSFLHTSNFTRKKKSHGSYFDLRSVFWTTILGCPVSFFPTLQSILNPCWSWNSFRVNFFPTILIFI